MAPRMPSLVRSQAQEQSQVYLKYFEKSVTIAVESTDINITLLENLRKFIEEDYIVRLCSIERGEELIH